MKDLSTLTIEESIKGLKSKDFSSLELTTASLDSIKKQEPELHAFVTVLEDDAIEVAKHVDQKLGTGEWDFDNHPLAGIPISLKDNFLTKNQRTTASSKVLDKFYPQFDSTVTRKIRDSGAVIVGKNNMDAWAHGSSTETSDYGPTHNPWDLSKLPGGSSGGSAAAVASNQVIGAIGSETAGSIRQPASWCGVYGFKPTYGRVSRYGVVAMEASLDSPGPLSKTVKDASILLGVIAGHDPYDATTPNIAVPNYFKQLNSDIKGLKIGLPKEYFLSEAQSGINEMVMNAANKLASLGAELINISMMDPKYSIADYTIIQRAGVSSNLSRYDGVRYGNDRTFFGAEAKRRIMLGSYALSSGYYDAYYRRAQQVRMLLKRDFDRIFSQVDIILAPTSPSTALSIGSTLDQSMFGELSDLLIEGSSLAGITGANIPVGLLGGLPVGMQIMANHFQEQKVLNTSLAYELSVDWKLNNTIT